MALLCIFGSGHCSPSKMLNPLSLACLYLGSLKYQLSVSVLHVNVCVCVCVCMYVCVCACMCVCVCVWCGYV